MVNHNLTNRIDPVFNALADPNRRRVVELLMEGPTRASTIAEHIGLARNAATRHLNLLRKTGLVSVHTSDSDARARIYQLEIERVVAAREWLQHVEANWRHQLKRFKHFAEGAADD